MGDERSFTLTPHPHFRIDRQCARLVTTPSRIYR
jgi:hypothetical protein